MPHSNVAFGLVCVFFYVKEKFYKLFWTQACTEGIGTNGTLRYHARCHPYPIPQPVKRGWPHHWGLRRLLFSNIGVGSFTRPTHEQISESAVFRPYPRRLESLTICRCHDKGSTFFSVIYGSWVLVRPGFEPATSRSADRRSPNWAYQAAVNQSTLK